MLTTPEPFLSPIQFTKRPSYRLASRFLSKQSCAKAKLERTEEAVEDIRHAIELTESLKDEVIHEVYFENLKERPCFKELMGTDSATEST